MDESKTEIRVQFNDIAGSIFPQISRNELVIRVQPNEAVYLKMTVKKPGLGMDTTISELDLSYASRYGDIYIPDAYEALLLDILNGDQSNFVRYDELAAAWSIFTPVLHDLDLGKVAPHLYPYGSRGLKEATEKIESLGFIRYPHKYDWSPASKSPVSEKLDKSQAGKL